MDDVSDAGEFYDQDVHRFMTTEGSNGVGPDFVLFRGWSYDLATNRIHELTRIDTKYV